MKRLNELVFGFSDAENYRRRENKDLFNRIFLRTDAVTALCQRNTFFLVGEKGTGKTAYAVHLSNGTYKNNRSIHKFIRETDYHKFISLRRSEKLALSDYTDIWKVIIYLLMSDAISSAATAADWILQFPRFNALKSAISEYYNNAFSPEIPTAFQFIENSQRAAELMAKYSLLEAKVSGRNDSTQKLDGSKFQTNLLTIERYFQDALSSIKMTDHHILFIDGIDIRPASIPYDEYLDCVKGLANAVWAVNNDFFPSIRDSPGRMKVVLLLRPDIFNSLGLQNRNTKLKDNSVLLNWNTKYGSYRHSDLFRLSDRIFSAQQEDRQEVGVAWDHYFPFDAKTVLSEQEALTSFILFLRYSFHRPRDILSILDTLHELYVKNDSGKEFFSYDNLMSPAFRQAYGEYLLGEIKDSLSFYYDEIEYESFLKFFEYLNGKNKFSYDQYIDAFAAFVKFLADQQKNRPGFMQTPEEFIQFLYDQNVICFIEEAEDERFIRWCFLERSPANISPKVKIGMNYEIHYGLANILNTGKIIRPRKKRNAGQESDFLVGRVKLFDERRGYGFIEQEQIPLDIHFSSSAVITGPTLARGDYVKFRLIKDKASRLTAIDVMRDQ